MTTPEAHSVRLPRGASPSGGRAGAEMTTPEARSVRLLRGPAPGRPCAEMTTPKLIRSPPGASPSGGRAGAEMVGSQEWRMRRSTGRGRPEYLDAIVAWIHDEHIAVFRIDRDAREARCSIRARSAAGSKPLHESSCGVEDVNLVAA